MEASARTTAERSPDGRLIDQLASAGSDLSKLHQIEFILHFPSQGAAERAELQLLGFAFRTTILPGRKPDERLILAVKVMYPLEPDLEGLREKLNAIAAQHRGSYEGWKARINQAEGRTP